MGGSGASHLTDPARRTGATEDAAIETLLREGSLEVVGRLVAASNASFLATVALDGTQLQAVYKPVAGERPLWDFPDGTLAGRERAAYLVSRAGGWNVVPTTVLREDARFGPGMVQRWVDVDEDADLLGVVAPGAVPAGWVSVVEAEDAEGAPVLLVHPDDPRLRSLAVFDAVANNADRKGGHLLPDSDGRLLGCDHGVTFHRDPKLRTVLWGWAGEALRAEDVTALERLAGQLAAVVGEGPGTGPGELAELRDLLFPAELRALAHRVRGLLADRTMPHPSGKWPAFPWPAW